MHPVLVPIGRLTIYTYGFFVALGFLAGILLARTEAKRLGEDPAKISDLFFYVLIAAIVGSRLFYVGTDPGKYLENPLEIFKLWSGGLVFYGGFIGGLIGAIVYIRKKGMELWRTSDMLAPSIAAGQFLGRIGCFFAGCCYGKQCELPWAVTFTHPATLAPMGVALHPTQLYSAMANLSIFAILWRLRVRKKYDGQLFWTYTFLYGVGRALVEIFRDDYRGGTIFGLFSISQVLGGVIALISVFMMFRFSRRAVNET
jgi:phosphatidylglycerol:prolipoprotein diacylglycerol transferase